MFRSLLWGWQSNFEPGFPASSAMLYLTYMCWAVLSHVAAGSWCGFRLPGRPGNHDLLLLHTVALTPGHWTNTHPSTLATIFAAQVFLTTISWHFNIFFFPLSPATPHFVFCYSFWLFLNAFYFSLFIIRLKFYVRFNRERVCFRRRKSRKFYSLFFPSNEQKKSIII